MRKLLFLSHRIPYPPTKGDKIRSFHILRHLASRFEIYLGTFFDDTGDEAHAQVLRSYCAEAFLLPIQPWKLARAAGAVISRRCISAAVYRDRRMTRWVQKTLAGHNINDVFVFCSSMAPYIWNDNSDRRVIIDFVDVDSQKWGQYSRSGNPSLRGLFSLEQRRVFQMEKRAGAACRRVVLSSAAEAALFHSLAPELADRIVTMENGVDWHIFDPQQTMQNPYGADSLPIVFTGAMDYRPNVDGASWFTDEIFPRVRERVPHTEFWIVGRNPTASVRRLAQRPQVKVTGTVDDIRPYLRHARCSVAPLREGRGIQNKVLEAMAMGKPVVATPTALQGVRAQAMREVLNAEHPAHFASLVVEVLSGKWDCIGAAARRCVIRDYDWSRNLQILDRLLGASMNDVGISDAHIPDQLVTQQ